MLAFEIKPVDFAPDLVELILSPASGVKTSIILTRGDLEAFSANLQAKATILRPISCALLQKTKMTINHE